MARTHKVAGMTLSQYRAELPKYRRKEVFQFCDVVKGFWLAQEQQVHQLSIECVQDWAVFKGLNQPYLPDGASSPATPTHGKVQNVHISWTIKDKDFANDYDLIDLQRPLLFGVACSEEQPSGALWLLDGHHRLRKAFLQKTPLNAVILNLSQTKDIEMSPSEFRRHWG